jgi:hypothetical protein
VQSRGILKKYTFSIDRNLSETPVSIPSVTGGKLHRSCRLKKIQERSMNLTKLALFASLALAPAAVIAQTPTTATPTPGQHDYDINQRKTNQQERIGQGVQSGQLTAGETSRLEHQEAGINKEEKGMRAQDNGHLTKTDRATIHQQQNQESRRIYRDKHNAKVR